MDCQIYDQSQNGRVAGDVTGGFADRPKPGLCGRWLCDIRDQVIALYVHGLTGSWTDRKGLISQTA